jgi:hypothetical protein
LKYKSIHQKNVYFNGLGFLLGKKFQSTKAWDVWPLELTSKLGMSKEMLQGYLKETLSSLFAIDKLAASPALP